MYRTAPPGAPQDECGGAGLATAAPPVVHGEIGLG
eukprot:COSAG02_NODE_18242_length_953_cov_27.555164_1_plen_34_part_10